MKTDPERGDTAIAMASYVYGIVDGSARAPSQARTVDERHPVELLPVGQLAALVSHVDLADFSGERLQAHLEDRAWLEEKVWAHEGVLEAALSAGPVLPMRFGVVYSDPSGVTTMIRRHHADLAATLDSVRDRTEWGLKLHAETPTVSVAEPHSEGPGAGAAYLSAKRDALNAEREATARQAEVARAVHAQLGRCAEKAAIMGSSRGTKTTQAIVLNAAYLVPDPDRDSFFEEVERLQRSHEGLGLTFEMTGPWPPYNFATVRLDDA